MDPMNPLYHSPGFRSNRFEHEAEQHRLGRMAPPQPRRPLLRRFSRALTDR